ncbi:hypothetical protein [Arthrobacter sp. A5]|uniref:hypothetical protein n=1 Tax=Arthrobacter sp. A5 TaxID=576926 RepID=UPI003DA97599
MENEQHRDCTEDQVRKDLEGLVGHLELREYEPSDQLEVHEVKDQPVYKAQSSRG